MRKYSLSWLGAFGVALAVSFGTAHAATLTVTQTNASLTKIDLDDSPNGGALSGTGNIVDPLYSFSTGCAF